MKALKILKQEQLMTNLVMQVPRLVAWVEVLVVEVLVEIFQIFLKIYLATLLVDLARTQIKKDSHVAQILELK